MIKSAKLLLRKIKILFSLAINANYRVLEDTAERLKISRIVDNSVRYNSNFNYLNRIAYENGIEIYNRNLKWMDDIEFKELIKKSPDPNQRKDRKFVAWKLANYTRNLKGDTVECGVLHGATSYLICKTYEKGSNNYHHVFDSFEGLSKPLNEDSPESEKAFKWAEGDLSVPLEKVRENLKEFDFIKYYKGWIPSKFNEVQNLKFRFVHIDVDLYQPTKDSLEFFFNRLVPGGILLCDDYGFHTCEGAFKAFNELANDHNIPNVIHLPTGQGFVTKY